jgi:hypothetical protein
MSFNKSYCGKSGGLVDLGRVLTIADDELDKC